MRSLFNNNTAEHDTHGLGNSVIAIRINDGQFNRICSRRRIVSNIKSQIERIVPWGEWLTLIRPYYYKGERGNKPYDLERMLRMCSAWILMSSA